MISILSSIYVIGWILCIIFLLYAGGDIMYKVAKDKPIDPFGLMIGAVLMFWGLIGGVLLWM
jgi:uncharacterized membrane protein